MINNQPQGLGNLNPQIRNLENKTKSNMKNIPLLRRRFKRTNKVGPNITTLKQKVDNAIVKAKQAVNELKLLRRQIENPNEFQTYNNTNKQQYIYNNKIPYYTRKNKEPKARTTKLMSITNTSGTLIPTISEMNPPFEIPVYSKALPPSQRKPKEKQNPPPLPDRGYSLNNIPKNSKKPKQNKPESDYASLSNTNNNLINPNSNYKLEG